MSTKGEQVEGRSFCESQARHEAALEGARQHREERRPKGFGRSSGPKRSSVPKRSKAISPATPAQRERVREKACIVCATHPCDPVHLIDRSLAPSMGDVTRMVIPLCRLCHLDYDDGDLDLSPYLEPYWRDAEASAVEAVGLFRALKRITKSTWIIVPTEEASA
jgi:hypothetical protein